MHGSESRYVSMWSNEKDQESYHGHGVVMLLKGETYRKWEPKGVKEYKWR